MFEPSKIKPKPCATCGNTGWKQFNSTDKYCSYACARDGGAMAANHGSGPDYRLIDWAKSVKSRDLYICRRCGVHNSNKNYIDAHHIKMKSTYPQFKYDVNNGVTLCRTCHKWVHANPKAATMAGYLYIKKYLHMQAAPREDSSNLFKVV